MILLSHPTYQTSQRVKRGEWNENEKGRDDELKAKSADLWQHNKLNQVQYISVQQKPHTPEIKSIDHQHFANPAQL